MEERSSMRSRCSSALLPAGLGEPGGAPGADAAAAAAASEALLAEGRAVGLTQTSGASSDPGGGLAPTAAASKASGTGALARSGPPRLPRRVGVRGGVVSAVCSRTGAVPGLGSGPDHDADSDPGTPGNLPALLAGRCMVKSWTESDDAGRALSESRKDLMRAAGVDGLAGSPPSPPAAGAPMPCSPPLVLVLACASCRADASLVSWVMSLVSAALRSAGVMGRE
mmetsp:Transcript_5333/g.13153  ORF Transcript_5333/g.13153 Transcript_5333/m.13153 type:complete len:225 (-) Transcript_5333:27-701(-)